MSRESHAKSYKDYKDFFLHNLQRTGKIATACDLTGISFLTFTIWKNQNPQFIQECDEAEDYHRRNKQQITRDEAEAVLIDYLIGRVKRFTHTRTIIRDRAGNIVSEIETVKEQTVPPTARILEIILFGADSEEKKAVITLARGGLIPQGLRDALLKVLNRTGTEFHQLMKKEYDQYETVDSKQRGLTDETADYIRSKFLGTTESGTRTIEAGSSPIIETESLPVIQEEIE